MTTAMAKTEAEKTAAAGLIFGLTAFGIWALFPLYWREIEHVDAIEILAHRVLWTVPVCALVLFFRRKMLAALATFARPKQLLILVVTTVLISTNWGVYIWSVTHDHVLQASMGYFLNPLVNVLAGLTVFGERLRKGQWLAVALAAAGVLYAIAAAGIVPWVGLVLAFSFGLYGALRKLVSVDAVPGLFVETLIMLPVAVGYVVWLEQSGTAQFLNVSWATDIFLYGAGFVTAVPLLCYVAAARRLPISTVGMLFYITPGGLFLLGTLLYGEPVTATDMVTFGCIWSALAVFTIERRRFARKARETAI